MRARTYTAQRRNLPHMGVWCDNGHALSGGLQPDPQKPPRDCEYHGVTHVWFRCPMRRGAAWCNDLVAVPRTEMVWDEDAQSAVPCFVWKPPKSKCEEEQS